jgi:hypothetical protein
MHKLLICIGLSATTFANAYQEQAATVAPQESITISSNQENRDEKEKQLFFDLLLKSAKYAANALIKTNLDYKISLRPPSISLDGSSIKFDISKYPTIPRAITEGFATEALTDYAFENLKELVKDSEYDYSKKWKDIELLRFNGSTITKAEAYEQATKAILSFLISSYAVRPISDACFGPKN